ncbi:MAG TPA: NAD(P)/FAD-dependent oxidoreductase [Burkholderiales bacterium]|nr:NAD(P)/FAD-dependent oxidoreductase [Burkholderiales bacterium]
MRLTRREFIKWVSASAGLGALPGCASLTGAGGPRVVVVGGGYAGATCAKYIRKWGPNIEVVLIERNAEFISCPLSNLVLGGNTTLCALTVGYQGLSKYGVKMLNDEVVAVDAQERRVQLARGFSLSYDRLIIAPGIHFMYEQIPGLSNPEAQQKVLHAWKAGTQTMALRNQLEAMPDGGVYALCIPKSPYRCPPGPYERACQVAFYFKQAKPRSKVLILDANDDVQSKKGLFTKAWKERYAGIVEYRPNSILVDVDAAALTARLEFENVSADVLNVIPPQRAGNIAQAAGLVTANDRWCGVDFLTYESAAQKNIHVLGDAIVGAPAMPKSGHMANQQAKVCAAAVAALLNEQPVNSQPMMNNTCYSFVSGSEAMHVASVHRYDAAKKTMLVVEGSTGLSTTPTELEGQYAWGWARNIWADMLA